MATRTTYTSTIRVPIYASWKCPCCGEKNFSLGNIVCQRAVTTSSLRKSKQEEAKNEASSRAWSEWQQNALNIIVNPQKNPQIMRRDLFLQNTECTKCGKKPKWDKGMGYMTLLSLCFMPAIISGVVAIAMRTSWIAWLIFAAFLGTIVYCIVTEEVYKKTIAGMPIEHLPVIGSQNEELLKFAEQQGRKLPTPDETIRIVGHFKSVATLDSTIDPSKMKEGKAVVDVTSPSIQDEQVRFCRKCGVRLSGESDFCNKCGTEVIR